MRRIWSTEGVTVVMDRVINNSSSCLWSPSKYQQHHHSNHSHNNSKLSHENKVKLLTLALHRRRIYQFKRTKIRTANILKLFAQVLLKLQSSVWAITLLCQCHMRLANNCKNKQKNTYKFYILNDILFLLKEQLYCRWQCCTCNYCSSWYYAA